MKNSIKIAGTIIMFSLYFINLINAQTVEIEGDGTSNRQFLVKNQGNENSHTFLTVSTASDQFGTSPNFEAKRSRGTLESPENINAGDRLLNLVGGMYYDGTFYYTGAVEIFVGESPGVNSYPTIIRFSTADNNESSRSERMRIAENGNVGIGTNDPDSKLQVSDGDVYIENIDKGVIMKSPNGQCWRITPDNTGSLVSTSIVCPN